MSAYEHRQDDATLGGVDAQAVVPVQDGIETLGARIRELRVAHDMTQADLARAVFVARQTVHNWEAGKTLPDARSLTYLAETFGITVDDLLGSSAGELVRATADARHKLVRAIVGYAIWYAAGVLLTIGSIACLLASRNAADPSLHDTLYVLSRVLYWIAMGCIFGANVMAAAIKRVMNEQDLGDALQVVAFLEGRRADAKRPDDVLYRTILPHWGAFRFLAAATLALVIGGFSLAFLLMS